MAIGTKLVFDVNNNVEDFIFILSTRDYRHLGALQNVIPDSVTNKGSLNTANEISLEIYKTVTKDGEDSEEPLWDDIDNFKLIYVRELDEYFEVNISLSDSIENVKKSITLTSLCEAELSQINIHGLESNTENDIARPDYVVTKFYNPDNHDASLLHRVLSYAPHYSIKHVDESLMNIEREFSIDGTSIYDWFVGECSEEFNCLFQFDSTDRTVSVYDLYVTCKDCGHRADESDFADNATNDYICPNCGSNNVKYFGEDTTIFIDKENLTDEIQFTTDTDSVKNCFKLVAGDDLMTATIRTLNMNGTDYIISVPDYQKKDMPEELVQKIESYDELYFSKQEEYEKYVSNMYEAQSQKNYYEFTMMPTIEQAEVTAQTEADKLTANNLSPLGMYPFTVSTSKPTVESALVNYAKVYVNTGYVKLEVFKSEYTYGGVGKDGFNYGTWKGNFKVTNYSDDEDIAYSSEIVVNVHGNYEEFINQKVMKAIKSNTEDDDDGSVFDVLSIDDLSDFKDALTYYCLERLKSFSSSIQAAMDVLVQVDQASEGADLYEPIYLPYYEKHLACLEEIAVRQSTIDEWTSTYDVAIKNQQTLQKELNFEDYLGKDLYKIFCAYKREDTYQNDNYISDGLSDAERIKRAKAFIENAKLELLKSSTQQHSITSTLYNLLLIPDFKPLLHMFKLGNWIRVCVDGEIYRLRLISYTLSFSSIQTLEVEFSNVTKLHSVTSTVGDILNSAQSMATSFAYVTNQASKGNEANTKLVNFVENGLNSSLINLKNNNNEEVVFNEHGLWARSFDPITGNYDPEQFRVTHNILAFTDNNWLSTRCSLGKHNYYMYDESGKLVQKTDYGLTSDFVISGVVVGSQLVGGEIYSENYSPTSGTHIDLNNGSMSLASGKIVYDADTNVLNLKEVTLDWNTTTSPTVDNIDGLNDKLDEINDSLTSLDEEFANELTNYVTNTVFNGSVAELQSQIDGNITTWFEDGKPMLNSYPSSEWTTVDEKNKHLGDLYYDNLSGYAYRFQLSGTKYDWIKITDTDVTKALADAKAAQDTADGKRRVFVTTPIPPYDIGDLWVQGDGGDILRCATPKTSEESYSASDWVLASKYTDDSALTNFINGEYSDDLEKIGTQIDGKARAWYQSTDPSLTWDKTEDHEGDLWYNTSTDSQVTSIYQNGAWKATSVPKSLFDTIDGIASIYVTIPDNPVNGDLLIPTNDIGNYKAGKVYKYNGTTWVEISYTDDTKANEALEAANKAQTTADSAKSVAENAETIGNNLVNVLGYDGTKITGTYIYSPVISGGSILVGNRMGTYAEITKEGVLNCAGANVTGNINATSLTLGTGVTIPSNNVNGLSSVATSGKYSDLSGTPTIPTSITDLTGSANILYTDSIKIESTTNEKTGVTTTTTTYGDKTYTTLTSSEGNYVLTNVGLGTDTNDASKSYTYISSDGLLTAKNAVIYGDIYATNGKFSGIINAYEGGTIGGFTIGSTSIYNGTNSLTSTEEGIYLGTDGIYNYKSDEIYTKISNGQLITTSGTIGGINITDTGLYYSGTDSTDGFGLWKNNWHKVGDKYIIFHAGANNSNISTAPFRVYQDGSLHASNATIEGSIIAKTGEIAGWTISSSRLYKEDTTSGLYVALASPTKIGTFGDGSGGAADVLVVRTGTSSTGYTYPLVISSDGSINATKANITGVLHAGKGSSLGGFETDNNSLFSGSWTSSKTPTVFMCTGSTGTHTLGGHSGTNWCFGAGTGFGVTKYGELYCNAGQIGNWKIDSSTGALIGQSNYTSLELHPNGKTESGNVWFVIIRSTSGNIISGLTVNGFETP